MQNKILSYVKGAAAGMAIGAAASMLVSGRSKKKSNMKKSAGKAIKVVGSVIDGMTNMMK